MKITHNTVKRSEWVDFFRALNILMMFMAIPYIAWISLHDPKGFPLAMTVHALLSAPIIYYQFGLIKPIDEFFFTVLSVPAILSIFLSYH